jgi:hypothetical protein
MVDVRHGEAAQAATNLAWGAEIYGSIPGRIHRASPTGSVQCRDCEHSWYPCGFSVHFPVKETNSPRTGNLCCRDGLPLCTGGRRSTRSRRSGVTCRVDSRMRHFRPEHLPIIVPQEGKRRIELCHSVQVECRCNTFGQRHQGRSGVPEPDMVVLVAFGAALLAVAMRRKGVTTRSTGSCTTVTSTSSIPSSMYRVSQRVQGGTRSVSVISGLGFDCLPTLVAYTEDSGRHEYETGRLGYG